MEKGNEIECEYQEVTQLKRLMPNLFKKGVNWN